MTTLEHCPIAIKENGEVTDIIKTKNIQDKLELRRQIELFKSSKVTSSKSAPLSLYTLRQDN